MKKKWFGILLACFLAVSLLSGCGSSGSSANSAVTAETAAAAAQAVSFDSSASMAEEGGGVESAAGLSLPQASGRKLIRNVHLSVETDSFDTLLSDIQSQISALSGYVEQSDISGSSMARPNSPSRRYASITARIPADSLDQFIHEVESRGNVTSRSETTEDVTLQYSDLESRKKTLTMEQERIWALLEEADTLEAVIALEERLSEIRYELESMESQLRLYDNQVDYSTVYLSISEVSVFTPTEPEDIGTRIRNGFSQNVERVADSMTTLFILILSTSPIWAACLAALALVLFAASRFRGRKGRAPSHGFWKKKKQTEAKDENEGPKETGK